MVKNVKYMPVACVAPAIGQSYPRRGWVNAVPVEGLNRFLLAASVTHAINALWQRRGLVHVPNAAGFAPYMVTGFVTPAKERKT